MAFITQEIQEILKDSTGAKDLFPTTTGGKKIIFNSGVEASINYAEPNTHSSPNIALLFSPFGLPFVPIEIVGTNANKIITGLQWTKDRNNPGGVLQCTLTPDSSIIEDIVKIIDKFSLNLYSTIWGELGVNLEDLFKPMTLCQLWIDGYHIMTGFVRGCSRSSNVENESKSVSYSIVIEELGNLLNLNTSSLDLNLKDLMLFSVDSSLKKATSLTANLKGVPLSVGLQAILNAFLADNVREGVTLSDGLPLLFRIIALASPFGAISNTSIGGFMTLDSSMYKLNSNGGSQQSIWSFLKSFIPNPWMEFFTESGGRTMVTDNLGIPSVLFPGFNYVASRTLPYSNPLLGLVNPVHLAQNLTFDLNALFLLAGGDFVIITDDMISNKTLGFDSTNQFTAFHSGYTNGGSTQAADAQDRSIKSVGPLNPFASGGVGTFGIREMFQTIDCTSLEGLGTTLSGSQRIAKNYFGLPGYMISKPHLSNLLAVWYRNQSRFREGSITCKNIPYARPGMYCLYLPTLSGKKVDNLRDIGIYYIDSLSHSYGLENENMSFETTLNLIRGVPLPTSVAQTALLLFDFEVLPPESGTSDKEYRILKTLRDAASAI